MNEPPKPLDRVSTIFEPDSESDQTQSSRALKALEDELQAERDKRLTERFVYVMIAVIALDAWVFAHIENWSGPIALTVLELVLLIVVGRMCGVEDISQLVTNMLRRAGDHVAGNKD